MSIRLAKPFCAGVAKLRARLKGRERTLFDLLCAAGELGYRLPDDDVNLRHASGARDPRKRLIREFSNLRWRDGAAWSRASDRVARSLARDLRGKGLPQQERSVRVLMGHAPIALAPDCKVPEDRLLRAAWDTSVKLFARLFPSSVKALGPLACVQRELPTLKREAAAGLRIGRMASGRKPGRVGTGLAVHPQILARVRKVLGKKVVPGYWARSLFYARPGDHIWPHADDPRFDVTLLICISHTMIPKEARRSRFLSYLPNGSVKHYDLSPGSGLIVEPGSIHAREPLQAGERVALISIGLMTS